MLLAWIAGLSFARFLSFPPVRFTARRHGHLRGQSAGDDGQESMRYWEFDDLDPDELAELLEELGEEALLDSELDRIVLEEGGEVSMMYQDEDWTLTPTELPLASVEDAAHLVREDGVVRIPAFSEATARALRVEVLEQLQVAQNEDDRPFDGDPEAKFSSVLSSQQRVDYRLERTPVVNAALEEMLAQPHGLGSVLEDLCGGGDSEMWELAALISAPGAPVQPLHTDTETADTPVLFTAFVALQDVRYEMGPTRFVPGTHPEEVLETMRIELARDHYKVMNTSVALLRAGETSLYDVRVRHYGMANTADPDSLDSVRILFYVTFRHVDADPALANDAGHSIRKEYRGDRKSVV